MSEACLKQIRYWDAALKQSHKAIRRKNNHIRRLQCENASLNQKVAGLMAALAEKELSEN